MRSIDVFGRKQNIARPFYLIIVIFILVLPGYFLIQHFTEQRLADLAAERVQLSQEINQVLAQEEENIYLEIGELLPYLPTVFSQNKTSSELSVIKDLAGLTLAENYQIAFEDDADSPFESGTPSTVKSVKITIEMTVSNPDLVLTYMNLIADVDTLYFIDTVSVSYLSDDSAVLNLVVYTFYNDVVIE